MFKPSILAGFLFLGVAAVHGGGQEAKSTHILEGRDEAVLVKGPIGGSTRVRFALSPVRYPLASDKNPAYQLLINPPITTEKVRLVSNDSTTHVTEIRLFEPGMPRYPDVLGEGSGGLDLPDFALGAKVSATSRWSDERRESLAVDGSLGFDSRWVSTGPGPHALTIDLGGERTLGCIQMVSGYLSGNEWKMTAGDFFFEFFQEDQWHRVPGSGRRVNTEASRFAITLTGDGREYSLMHRNEKNNWLIVAEEVAGQARILKEYSFPRAQLREGSEHHMEILVTPKTAALVLDGTILFNIEHDLGQNLDIAVKSLSGDAEIRVKGIEIGTISAARTPLLSDLIIEPVGGDGTGFIFNPLEESHRYPLTSGAVRQIRVQAVAAVPGQVVSIQGKAVKSTLLDLSAKSATEVKIQVTSADRTQTRLYDLKVTPVPPWDGYELAFEDDFEGREIDPEKWDYRIGQRWKSQQRPENVSMRDGNLVIRLEVDREGNQFTGGIISKEPLGYGYYETRARLWKGKGWHSAFWQMQADDPRVNEIDGFESVSPDSFSTNLHYYHPRSSLGAEVHHADVAGDFNTFAWEWLPDRVRFYFNGELIRDQPYPGPHLPQHVWLSCVARTDASVDGLPGSIEFEYFRFYKPVDAVLPGPDSVILDTNSAAYTETGEWESTGDAISHRGDFATRVSSLAGSTATWTAAVEESGNFEVFVWNAYVYTDGNSSRSAFEISHFDGNTQRVINPMKDGQGWVSLGTFRFSSTARGRVRMDVEGQTLSRADAVMFVPRKP